MENYAINSSSIHKSVASRGTTRGDHHEVEEEEESGWTAYFEDFSNIDDHHHDQLQNSCFSNNNSIDFSCGSSLISDAATTDRGAAWKISHHNNNNPQALASSAPKKFFRFKKTRTEEICDEDDSLEDTASSPVHSPKVSDWKMNEMNPRKREDQTHSSQLGKETACSSKDYIEIDDQIEEESKRNFDHGKKKKMKMKKKKNDCIELKKRGVCLVPLSMLVNYLG